MVVKHCCYGRCRSDSRYRDIRDMQGVEFLRMPLPGKDVEKARRWANACGREGFSEKNVTRYTYICTKHFVGGKGPTDSHPDPIPRLTPAQVTSSTILSPQTAKFTHGQKRPTTEDQNQCPLSKHIKEECDVSEMVPIKEEVLSDEDEQLPLTFQEQLSSENPESHLDKAVQTEYVCSELMAAKIDIKVLENKIADLQQENQHLLDMLHAKDRPNHQLFCRCRNSYKKNPKFAPKKAKFACKYYQKLQENLQKV